MNVSEKKAYRWLQDQGIAVRFRVRQSPDFITPEGVGYEVKFARPGSNAIHFTYAQHEALKKFPGPLHILVFERNINEPQVFKFEDILKGEFGRHHVNITPCRVIVFLEPEVFKKARIMAMHEELYLREWIAEVVKQKVQKEE